MFTDGVLETGHDGEVLDVAMDANGTHLATASDDGSIHIFECDAQGGSSAAGDASGNSSANASANPSNGPPNPNGAGGRTQRDGGFFSSTGPSWRLLCKVTPPHGESASPVTCLAWAPLPFYRSAIVACMENGKVSLLADFSGSKQYEAVYQHQLQSPGRCVAWAPQEYGKLFAVGCASGVVTVFTGLDQTWDVSCFTAHHRGCFGLSFAPFFPPGTLLMVPLESEVDPANPPPPVPIAPPRIVTCGGGRGVKVWVHSFSAPSPTAVEADGAVPESVWMPMELSAAAQVPEVVSLSFQKVAWAPNVGLPYTYIAAGTENGYVAVWTQDGPFHPENGWQCALLPQQMSDRVTNLSWSMTATFLLVSGADGTASMWKETTGGRWEMVSEIENPVTA